MKPIEAQPGFEDILREQELFGGDPDDNSLGNRMNLWFDKLMVQSGLSVSPTLLLTICLFFGVVVGGIILVVQENPLTASMFGVAGAISPVLVVMFIRGRRQRQVMESYRR